MPFSDEEAKIVPVELMERKEMGDLCAWMTFATVRDRVENSNTSPACDVGVVAGGDAVVGCVVAGDGTGEGYAR